MNKEQATVCCYSPTTAPPRPHPSFLGIESSLSLSTVCFGERQGRPWKDEAATLENVLKAKDNSCDCCHDRLITIRRRRRRKKDSNTSHQPKKCPKPKNTPPPKTRCHGERSIKWRLLPAAVVVESMTVAVVGGGGGGGSTWLVNLSLLFVGSLVAAFIYLWIIAPWLEDSKEEEEGGIGKRGGGKYLGQIDEHNV